jgi:hypothetical protein
LIIPLDQCYEAFGVKPREQYYPSVIDDVSYDGKIYGIPQFFQANALLANKRVLDKAGVTAAGLDTSKPDEIVASAKKLYQEKGGKPTVIGFDADLPGSSAMWFTVFGGAAFDEQGKPTLDRPENVKALTWMKQLMDAQGGYPKVKSFKDSMDVFGAGNQYVKDQVAVQTWAQWYPNVLADTKDKVSLEAVPIKDAGGAPIAMAGGTSFAIPKSGKNPSAACAWAIKATSSEAWMAAADARIETVEKNKKLFTGLMTGSPVADQQIKDKYVKPTGNAEFDQVIAGLPQRRRVVADHRRHAVHHPVDQHRRLPPDGLLDHRTRRPRRHDDHAVHLAGDPGDQTELGAAVLLRVDQQHRRVPFHGGLLDRADQRRHERVGDVGHEQADRPGHPGDQPPGGLVRLVAEPLGQRQDLVPHVGLDQLGPAEGARHRRGRDIELLGDGVDCHLAHRGKTSLRRPDVQ